MDRGCMLGTSRHGSDGVVRVRTMECGWSCELGLDVDSRAGIVSRRRVVSEVVECEVGRCGTCRRCNSRVSAGRRGRCTRWR